MKSSILKRIDRDALTHLGRAILNVQSQTTISSKFTALKMSAHGKELY